jgi:LCP family protein required for cell wall assembly
VYGVERRSGRKWKRIVLWSVIGIFIALGGAAGGYYLWLDAKVSGANERVPADVWEALADDPTTTTVHVTSTSLPPEPTTTTEPAPEAPDAMNVLLLGSDRRSKSAKYYGLSDTIILLHVDPGNNYLSMLSLPRDLRVQVAGYGTQKINAAYSYGGPALTIRTVQEVTGLDMDHYLEVDFQAFRDMTDSLGGVYVEVDRRYYYNGASYERINLQPGFQLLDGADALDYVRFRHDGNLDFGRMERQQRFLSALRQQAMGWDLAFKLPGLINAFFDNVATDLGTNDFIKLAWWGIRLDGARIRQVSLIGRTKTIAGSSYVVCTEEQIAAAVEALLTVPGSEETPAGAATGTESSTATTAVAAADLTGVELDVFNSSAGMGEAAATGEWLRSLGATVVTVDNTSEAVGATLVRHPSGMSAAAQQVASVVGAATVQESGSVPRITVILGSDFAPPAGFTAAAGSDTIPASAIWRALAKKVGFAVRAPAYIPDGYTMSKRTDNNATVYKIKVGDGTQPAFIMLYKSKGADQYLNITETTWLDASAASVGREITYNDTVFTVVGSTGKVERVWWRSDGVLYWVGNTLSHLASEEELLAVAESMILIPAQ